MVSAQKGLGIFTLAMLITGAIDSVRNLPATALFGSSLVFFFCFAAIVFLLPTALISAQLSSTWTDRGGIFHWVKLAFGDTAGFIAIWLQWVSNLVWFPTILSFIAGTFTYLIDPSLADNKYFLVSVILITFWALTLFNLKGAETSAKFATFCAIFGLIMPMVIIISLAVAWVILGNPIQIDFTAQNMLPNLKDTNQWTSLTPIMTAFLGMELAAVHIKDVHNSQTTFPRALLLSVFIILITMILGALSIAIVLPHDKISLVNGVMQAFSDFFAAYHISWMVPVMSGMLVIGSLGGIISWVISPAKGLLQAAQTGFMPAFMQKENKHGVASNLLIIQALLVSLFCVAFFFMPSVNGSYWLLTALSTQLYILMYVLMFIGAIYLSYKYPNKPHSFSIPGGKLGMWFVSLLGLIGCAITLIIGFVPPDAINVGSLLRYELIFGLGMAAMIAPAAIFIYYRNKHLKK